MQNKKGTGFQVAPGSQQLAEIAMLVSKFTPISNLLGGGNGNFINPSANLAFNAHAYDAVAVSCINNEQVFRATAPYGNVYFDVNPTVIGHIYYVCAYVKATSNLVGIEFMDEPYFPGTKHSGSGSYEFLSVEYTKISSDADILVAPFDERTSGWTNVSVKQMILLDKTALGIESKTKSQLDILVKHLLDTKGYITEEYIY